MEEISVGGNKTYGVLFQGAYNRTGTIWINKRKCCCCQTEQECLNIDSSEEEYGPGSICRDCIELLFKARANDQSE